MNRSFWKLLSVIAIISAPLWFAPFIEAQKKEPAKVEVVREDWAARPIVKGQLLVALHDGVKVEDLKPIFEKLEAKYEVVHRLDSVKFYTIATEHERLPELKQRLSNHPYIASCSYNGVSEVSKIFNDPVFKKPQDKPEDEDNWNLYRINLPEAWDITTGGTVVAVIDSGAVLDHEDLVGRIVNPFSFATGGAELQEGVRKVKRGKNIAKQEIRDHGTHVSITIAGNADNGVGTAGVAPSSQIMPIQALTYRHLFPDEDAGMLAAFDNSVAEAIAMAIERRASVVNMSIGGVDNKLLDAWHSAKTDAEKNDIGQRFLAKAEDALRAKAPLLDRAVRAGVILVVAAGNENIPAEFDDMNLSRRCIAVAATTREDKRAAFSNYGPFTTVSAPGLDIWSGYAEPGKKYGMMSGTSMACPHACGVVSLMQTIDPGLKHADVEDILIKTGRPLATDQPIGPLINAKAALEETQRRREKNIRLPEPAPMIPDPGMNPTLPQLPKDGDAILLQPAPWNNPNIRRLIRLWLAFANPIVPPGGGNVRWFFNMNGQVVNNNTVLVVPRPLWFQFNFQWLVQNGDRLDSTNLGTLNEFLVGTLRQGKFDPAPTRVPEKFRPKQDDKKPPQAKAPLDPNLDKTKWSGANKKGDKIDFEFGDGKLTINHNGKKTTYTPKFNTFVKPISFDLYPDHGGNPIRGLLNVKGLDDIAFVTDFTHKRPDKIIQDGDNNFAMKHGEPPAAVAKAEPPKPKPKPRPAVIGFQDGDAKKVHPDFFSVINDGTQFCAKDMADFAKHTASAGPRTGIASRVISPGPPSIGHHWVVRKFTEAKGPKQYLANLIKDPVFNTPPFDNGQTGFKIVGKLIEKDHVKMTMESYSNVGQRFQQSIHMYTFVHRDDFLVTISLYEGKRGHDFSKESRRIADETKKLIDERFPPPEPAEDEAPKQKTSGFLPGDGARVHVDLANAKVMDYDGQVANVLYSDFDQSGSRLSGQIIRYSSREEAKKRLDVSRTTCQERTKTKPAEGVTLRFPVMQLSDTRCKQVMHSFFANAAPDLVSVFEESELYRDAFYIYIGRWSKQQADSFDGYQDCMAKAKQLIDERFPKE